MSNTPQSPPMDWLETKATAEAEQIRRIGDNFVQTLTVRIDDPNDPISADRPLFVPIGEEHTTSAHILLQTYIMDQMRPILAARNMNMACGLELAHNRLDIFFSDIVDEIKGYSADNIALAKSIWRHNQHNQDAIASNLTSSNAYASVSKKIPSLFAQKYHISISFNDAARIKDEDDNYYLDPNDPLTKIAIESIALCPPSPHIDAKSPLGVHIRNKMLIEHAQDHAAQSEASVYFMLLGDAHVRGSTDLNFPFETSITDLLQESNHAVSALSVFVNDTPSEALNCSAITSENLIAARSFCYTGDAETWDLSDEINHVKYIAKILDLPHFADKNELKQAEDIFNKYLADRFTDVIQCTLKHSIQPPQPV